MGNSPVLVPKPISTNTKANSINVGSSKDDCLRTSLQNIAISACGITLAALAYTSTVPNRPKATPTVQIMMYFHADSSDER
ncbi:Uncharacterised protein [Shigella sonnei]|nr:Uncharacterised protein [Shigella sonnei]SRN46956.1 Uncharacterised protein [Shigella flexneri]CSE96994.1 Uncharacterised protein [Shigella sonnei]CSF09628.1 Uncharacterised protein [Shigella sonnei]CSF75251.1 Uncharacterised protein [Shigella sonnei]